MRTFLAGSAIPIALLVLVLWAVGTFYFEAPGWFHGLLTGGIFLLLWGIIARPVRRKKDAPGVRR